MAQASEMESLEAGDHPSLAGVHCLCRQAPTGSKTRTPGFRAHLIRSVIPQGDGGRLKQQGDNRSSGGFVGIF